MISPPDYFENIRKSAKERWELLESDPDLAGPWHQLFKQVQSPRHILSELLQNADDANATEAIVSIENGVFVFSHNGEDFIESHFASICRFGYSNKRALHTIGFRGIGFKSTFSLGDRVNLDSPTLSIAFDRQRFTLPVWIENVSLRDSKTHISVKIKSKRIERELTKNLQEWVNSPVSLLFFKNIRSLKIDGTRVEWESVGKGPVARSEWMALDGNLDDPYLVIKSEPVAFPQEALSEIQDERMIGSQENSSAFPPCSIEIVLGAKGRLYVVLPTGVETRLPFACNAPFIQDPARLKIKDPETSPTNLWLLKQAGELAANAMCLWLGAESKKGDAKELAYDLFPDVDREETSLEGLCGKTVELAFEKSIDAKPIILTSEDTLIIEGEGCFIPERLLEIWDGQNTSELFEEDPKPLVSIKISEPNREKLISRDLIENFTPTKFYERLRSKSLPQPRTWNQLLQLWDYLSSYILSYKVTDISNLAIVPVKGQDNLYPAKSVVRLGEKRLVQSDEDWQFLSPYLKAMNQNWTRFLAEKKRGSPDKANEISQVENAYRVLTQLGLDDTHEINAVLERVSEKFFSEERIKLSDCVRVAQIHAKLGASVGSSFKYVNEASYLKGIDEETLRDKSGLLEYLVPAEKQDDLLLHSNYEVDFISCTREEWNDWAISDKSQLHSFVPIVEISKFTYGRKVALELVKQRYGPSEIEFPYKTDSFIFKDWDFPDIYWEYWQTLEASDPQIWSKVLGQIFSQRLGYWRKARSARMLQKATTGSVKATTQLPILPNWILRFQKLPSLTDKYENLHKPRDLFRRTSATEPFLDTEQFVSWNIDREATSTLLDLLGVQKTPIDGSKLVSRIEALSGEENAPVAEVEKWYRRLDQYLENATPVERLKAQCSFRDQKLILANDGTWQSNKTIFIHADEDSVPGAALVPSSLTSLNLWRKLGVADRPSFESALEWLKSIPNGKAITTQNLQRIKSLTAKYPLKIWEDCQKWLNISGEWVEVDGLLYSLSMQTLTHTQHLFSDVKSSIADFQKLPFDIAAAEPFSSLQPLQKIIQDHLQSEVSNISENLTPRWLHVLGGLMSRIHYSNEDQMHLVQHTGKVLSKISISIVEEIRIVPFIEGNPVGTERKVKVFQNDQFIFVNETDEGKLAKLIPDALGKNLPSDVRNALTYCYQRGDDQIRQYMSANFDLESETNPQFQKDQNNSTDNKTAAPETSCVESDPVNTGFDNLNDDPTDIQSKQSFAENSDDSLNIVDEDVKSDQSIEKPKRPNRSSHEKRLRLIDRYAQSENFFKTADGKYKNQAGDWIGIAQGNVFPFERRSKEGNVLRYYLPKEHCLERDPLELEAECWNVIEKKPELYSLILVDPADNPIILKGARLLELREKGELKLFPAKYRLSYA